jgi:predicted transcriptional regulator
MTEPTVESMFGVKAGLVWEAINKNGPCSINELAKITDLRRELVYGALGWLARENKISMERSGRTLVFSLKE